MGLKNLDHNTRVKILFQYMTGSKVESILAKYNINSNTLYSLLKKYNVPYKRDVDSRKYFRDKIFYRLMKENMTIQEVADDMGLPHQVVHGFVNYEREQMKKKKQKEMEKQKKVDRKKLRRDGLQGSVPSSSNGSRLSVAETDDAREKRDSYSEDSEYKKEAIGEFTGIFSKEEESQLVLLRELLRYASEVSNLPDYSKDPLLLPDYLLPIDVLIMKDINARISEGESLKNIAKVHRTDENLIVDLVEEDLSREKFRDRYIETLVKKGFIQL